ncbi:MAG: chromosomal replication initiator protein DnaA [Candidatus Firestonebacteria bacterium]
MWLWITHKNSYKIKSFIDINTVDKFVDKVIRKAMDSISIWNILLDELKKTVNKHSFATWFTPTKFISYNDNVVTIEVQNNFSKEWLEKNYLSIIEETLKTLENKDIKVSFIVSENQFLPITTPVHTQSLENQNQAPDNSTIIGSPLNPKYIFENFIVGDSNRFANGACVSVAKSPAKSYNPVFIYGGVGLGKTHLLHAIGNFIKKEVPASKIAYLSSEQFLNEMISALVAGKMKIEDFRNKYRLVDVLLIDDIQFLEGKEMMQEEFFHTFNVLYDANKQIVATCDSKPQELKIEERLKSRFEMGLIADIIPPDLETRVAILKKKGEGEKIFLTNDICLFIANLINDDVRKLEGCLTKLIAYASITKSKISLDLAKECLKEIFTITPEKKATVESIKDAVVKYYKLRPLDMATKKRTQPAAFARQVAMYITRELTDMSLPEIGQNFGGRDHSTVIHAYETINNKKETDLVFSEELKNIITLINKS